jgi:hypothetical protein
MGGSIERQRQSRRTDVVGAFSGCRDGGDRKIGDNFARGASDPEIEILRQYKVAAHCGVADSELLSTVSLSWIQGVKYEGWSNITVSIDKRLCSGD